MQKLFARQIYFLYVTYVQKFAQFSSSGKFNIKRIQIQKSKTLKYPPSMISILEYPQFPFTSFV